MATATGKPPGPGSGNFDALVRRLSGRKGVRNPAALAATIGRKKYGAKKMAKWSAQGRSDADSH